MRSEAEIRKKNPKNHDRSWSNIRAIIVRIKTMGYAMKNREFWVMNFEIFTKPPNPSKVINSMRLR